MTTEKEQLLADLRGAREILSDPARWCQNHYARNADGKGLDDPFAKDAVAWCLRGACAKVAGSTFNPRVDAIYSAFKRISPIPHGSIVWFNDESTHAQLLTKLDAVIDGVTSEAA